VSNIVNPTLIKDAEKFGVQEWNACYHCGNCTAVCPLTESNVLFPRKPIRLLQMGLKDKLAASPEPWMCYYCGDCSETCPRDANPGEIMMSLRRFLTSLYDWTGLSKLFFTSLPALLSAFVLVGLVVLGIGFTQNFEMESIMHIGHTFEMAAIFTVALVILLPGILRMFWFSIIKAKTKVPLPAYITKLWQLVLHMFTQLKGLQCTGGTIRWGAHFLVVLGYITFLFSTVFLNWFTTETPVIIYLGYVVSALVTLGSLFFLISRITKKKEVTKFSHISDWFFVIWLFLMGLTGFLVRLFWDVNLLSGNIWLYMVHIMVLAQWALIIVPFGKWTHFLYRPFALYFTELRKAATQSN